MARVGGGRVVMEWDNGETVEIGTVELSSRAKGTVRDVDIKIPRWKIGVQFMWLGLRMLWPFRKRGADEDE